MNNGNSNESQAIPSLCVVATTSQTFRAFLLEQLVFLSRKGIKVTIICDRDAELLETCPQELEYIPFLLKRDMNISSTLKSFFQLLCLFQKKKYTMVQYCTPKASFVASIAAAFAGIPVRLYCQWGIRYVGFEGSKRLLFKAIERIICFFSTHVSPDSNGNRLFSVAEGLYAHQKSSVVMNGSANGVSLERFDIQKKDTWRKEVRSEFSLDTHLVFGWVGRLCRDKGVSELVEAFCNLYENEQGIALLLAGPKESKHDLSEQTVQMIVTHPAIRYLGEREDIERIYAAMDVLVSPSYREGFGSTAIEAQAMGVPVILSDIPGPREALKAEETGILVPARSAGQLQEAMQSLLFDEERRRSMGKAAREFVVENFEQKKFWNAVFEHRIKLIMRGSAFCENDETR